MSQIDLSIVLACYNELKVFNNYKEIQKILDEKDSNEFKGDPFSKKVALIHTDEPIICSDDNCKKAIESHSFNSLSQIQEAYIVFFYDPKIKTYPYIKLKCK